MAAMFILFTAAAAVAGDAAPHAQAIVKKANHMALYQGAAMKGRVSIEIRDKQGRVRRRVLNILRRDNDGEGEGGQKYFAYFRSPADVRKMVFMVHKHADPAKEDDRWLYMPAMDLVKRIASGDKRTSFVGSDFLYEDISGRGIYEDSHRLVETTATHFILENRPKDPGGVAFDHYLAHINRRTFVTEKLEFYKKGGRLYRTMEALEVKNIAALDNGRPVSYPTVVKSKACNLSTGSVSLMTVTDIEYNPELGEKVFSERYLRRPPREITR
ncbi:MAG: outer membrane lipoprotein-sorting protein [Desulfobacter sp.]|nr:MAG: outer membrane lipoprotein-sorting protein [Desulfobacter sp.]